MDYKYTASNTFFWSFAGFTKKEMAEAALADVETWFKSAYDVSEWEVSSSVTPTPQGFKADFHAKRTASVEPENG